MQVSFKRKVLFMISALIALFLAGMLVVVYLNLGASKEALTKVRDSEIASAFAKNINYINTLNRLIEKNAIEVSTVGESFYKIKQGSKIGLDKEFEKFLTSTAARFPTAVGAGVWYEPNIYEQAKKYYGPYVYWDKGKPVFTWEYSIEKYDYHNQDWYRIAIPKGAELTKKPSKDIIWTAPYYDDVAKVTMITCDAYMFDDSGKIIGIATTDWDLAEVIKHVANIKVTQNTSAILIDDVSKKVVSYSKDQKMNLKNYEELSWTKSFMGEKIDSKMQIKSLTINGEEHQVYFARTHSGMVLAILIPTSEAYAAIDDMKKQSAIAIIAVFCVLTPLALWVLYVILGAVQKMLGLQQNIASIAKTRDFTIIKNNITSNDEIGDTTRAFSELIYSLNTAIDGAKKQSSANAVISLELSSTSMDVTASNKEAWGAMDKIVANISKMKTTVSESVDDARQTKEDAVMMDKRMSGAKSVTESLIHGIHHGADKEQELSDKLSRLSSETEQVKNILVVISDIAEQTNLLALNAAIEAARAGEHGRGFAVVADEVRKLAERTQKSLTEINATISVIVQNINDASEEMVVNAANIKAMAASSQNVGEAMGDVTVLTKKTIESFDKSEKTSEAIELEFEKILQEIANVGLFSKTLSDSMDKINYASSMLHKSTDELNDKMNQFKTNG